MNFKFFFHIWLIFEAICDKFIPQNSETLSISQAINEVVDEFYNKIQIQFDIVTISDNPRKFSLSNDVLIASNGIKNSHRLSSFSNNFYGFIPIHNSAIILSSTINYFRFININFILPNQFTKSFKFLIFIENCEISFIRSQIKYFVKNRQLTFLPGSIENFSILLINNNDILYLASIEWFTESACNHPQLIILNTFNKTTQKWSKKLQNYEKFQNFHNCVLTMSISTDTYLTAFANIVMDSDNHKGKVIGLIPRVFMDISRKYNFIPKFKKFDDEPKDSSEVCFIITRMNSVIELEIHFTSSFLELKDIILATPGELYTPYEKLWLPFDDLTWNFLIFVFFVAFVVIFIINCLPKLVREGIYGVNIHKPALNVISAFFGIAQHKVPVQHFPRCLFIIFVFFCLIFRTCYQSKLFEFMTSEPRRPPPKTIEDLRVRNYTMYTFQDIDDMKEIIEDDKRNW